MSVGKRKDRGGKWYIHIKMKLPDGAVHEERRLSPVQTKRGAERYERQRREEILNPTPVRIDAPTLAEFWGEYVGYAETNRKAATVLAKKSMMRLHLLPVFGSRKLDEIDRRSLESYKVRKAKEGLAAKTINNQLTALRSILTTARDWGQVEQLPVFEWLKTEKPDFDFFDFDEAERLIAGADPGLWQTMVLVALNTGMRFGELMAWRWDDVDLQARRMRVARNWSAGVISSPKGGRPREAPLNSRVVAALKSWRHLRGELVFCREDGSMIPHAQMTRPLWRACRRAGLRRVGWRVLRHTFASHLVMRGVPLKAVQELMGHATMDMTLRYAHLSPNVSRDAVEALCGDQDHHRSTKRSFGDKVLG